MNVFIALNVGGVERGVVSPFEIIRRIIATAECN